MRVEPARAAGGLAPASPNQRISQRLPPLLLIVSLPVARAPRKSSKMIFRPRAAETPRFPCAAAAGLAWQPLRRVCELQTHRCVCASYGHQDPAQGILSRQSARGAGGFSSRNQPKRIDQRRKMPALRAGFIRVLLFSCKSPRCGTTPQARFPRVFPCGAAEPPERSYRYFAHTKRRKRIRSGTMRIRIGANPLRSAGGFNSRNQPKRILDAFARVTGIRIQRKGFFRANPPAARAGSARAISPNAS